MFDYEAEDEPIEDPKMKFKVSFYFAVLDVIINSLEERFDLFTKTAEYFKFLSSFKEITNLNDDELRENCDDLEILLTDGREKDIISTQLFEEIKIFRDIFKDEKTGKEKENEKLDSLELLQHIYENNLQDIFPNLVVSLKVLLTLPISVATGERSFSKLKIIKNYLRANISQERLVGLSMIAIESEICDQIETKSIIEKFATMKARRVNFELA